MSLPVPDKFHYPRMQLAQRIIDGFEQNLQHAATIFAPRRKGKTTFVTRDLIPLAREHGFIVATADLWMNRDNPEEAIARALYEAIHGAGFVRRNFIRFMRPGMLVKSVKASAGADGGALEAELAEDHKLDLQELFVRFSKMGKGKALLVIDEVQHLATRKEFESLTAKLRALLQSAQGEVFAVFTGSSQSGLAKMFRRSKAPFYQFSSEVPFPELGRDYVSQLGALFFETSGRHWDEGKVFELFLARGQMPMYLRSLYDYCLHGFKLEEADKIVWQALMDEGQYEMLLRDLPPLDTALIVAILCGDGLFTAKYREELADVLPSGKAPSTAQVQAALKRLQNRDVVANIDHGQWVIEDGALESYLRRMLIDSDPDEEDAL